MSATILSSDPALKWSRQDCDASLADSDYHALHCKHPAAIGSPNMRGAHGAIPPDFAHEAERLQSTARRLRVTLMLSFCFWVSIGFITWRAL